MKKIKVTAPYLVTFTISLLLTACGGDDNPTSPEPTTGAVEVTIYTSGSDKDEDGYTVSVDGSNSQAVDTSDAVVIPNLEEGSHEMELSGTAVNCSVSGDNPQSVDITAGDTTSASFEVSCSEVLNNQIVFMSDRGGQVDLYLMNPDGTGVEQLTDNADAEEHPAVSPNGMQIAYSQSDNIWVINADGSNPEQLTSTGEDMEPAWSPDGEQIVFTSQRDVDAEIYVMDADGSNQQNLTNDPGWDNDPDWSPDGERIVFTSDRDGGDLHVYTMNTEGTALQNLSGSFIDGYASWSLDGNQLVFASNESGTGNFHVMDADGGNRQQLTDLPAGSITDVSDPSWSPDGTEIVFTGEIEADFEIYTISTDDGGSPTNLTVNMDADLWADWSPVE